MDEEKKGMLVLSRKIGERIFIGEDIVITIVDVHGGGERAKIRLGISAPSNIEILREELRRKPDEGQPAKAK